jgi:hypothetical protein
MPESIRQQLNSNSRADLANAGCGKTGCLMRKPARH